MDGSSLVLVLLGLVIFFAGISIFVKKNTKYLNEEIDQMSNRDM